MNRIHLSSKLLSKNLKSIPYTDWCYENKDIIKLIIKKKNLKVHSRLRLKNRKHIKNNLIIFLRFCHSYKFFYVKNSFKKGKRVKIIKLLFFKIKCSRN